jgi:Transposase DDE domain
MLELNCIKNALAPSHWNEARRDFLARFIVALLTAQTACLYRLASLFPSKAQITSRYHRIRRFFRQFDFDQSDFAKIILALAIKAGANPPFVLSFDRTEWYLGTVPINIFMMGIVCKQIAFPVIWIMLDKAGSSDANERIDLLAKAVALLGKEKIAFVIGDREFVCHDLLKWLHQEKIGYRLRLRQDVLVTNGLGEQVTAGWLFHRFALGKEQYLEKARQCLGHYVFLAGMRFVDDKGKKDYLIVVSNEPAPLSDYALRWSIENLFSGLKSRGFNLEATHLLENERISRLLSVLALAFCWSVVVGMADFEQREREGRPMKRKGHGRFGVSAFRNGLDRLRSLLAPLCGHFDGKGLQSAIQFLYGT